MTKQAALDLVEVAAARKQGYVVNRSPLVSSCHLDWLDVCRRDRLPYLALFPGEPTFTVDLSFCRPDLDVVRRVYQDHRIRPECATVGRYDHYVRRRRAEPLARDLWLALTGKETSDAATG